MNEQTPKTNNPQDGDELPEGSTKHVVQSGENLTQIATHYYGPEQGGHWITLYNFNREVIGPNPDIIHPGVELVIPDLSEFLNDI